MKYVASEIQVSTFHMAAGRFYEMVGREEPYVKEELDNIEIYETPTDMDRHLQTQADRIEFEMNAIQESWRWMKRLLIINQSTPNMRHCLQQP